MVDGKKQNDVSGEETRMGGLLSLAFHSWGGWTKARVELIRGRVVEISLFSLKCVCWACVVVVNNDVHPEREFPSFGVLSPNALISTGKKVVP